MLPIASCPRPFLLIAHIESTAIGHSRERVAGGLLGKFGIALLKLVDHPENLLSDLLDAVLQEHREPGEENGLDREGKKAHPIIGKHRERHAHPDKEHDRRPQKALLRHGEDARDHEAADSNVEDPPHSLLLLDDDRKTALHQKQAVNGVESRPMKCWTIQHEATGSPCHQHPEAKGHELRFVDAKQDGLIDMESPLLHRMGESKMFGKEMEQHPHSQDEDRQQRKEAEQASHGKFVDLSSKILWKDRKHGAILPLRTHLGQQKDPRPKSEGPKSRRLPAETPNLTWR